MVLREFLGLDWRDGEARAPGTVEIRVDGEHSRSLTLSDAFLATRADLWLRPESLPRTPLREWEPASEDLVADLVEPRLPVLFGSELEGGGFLRWHPQGAELGLDVFGSAFFMLARYEEVATPARDEHDRFRPGASLAKREGFLERPVVNEYVEVLRALLLRLWPALTPRRRGFRQYVSHDVDWPLQPARAWPVLAKSVAGDVLLRRSASRAVMQLKGKSAHRSARPERDPFFCFDWIMERSEERGIRSAFYFMAGRSDPRFDGDYSLEEPPLQRLLTRIHRRGHEIGLHPSYATFRSPELILAERDRLLDACRRAGVDQESWGGRQHYLRWENPITWRGWAEAGLSYDSSLGFGRDPGFRCGTCYEYPVFDLVERRRLALRERPLLVMEMGIIDPEARAAGRSPDTVAWLRERCRRFGGDFTLLWHNSRLGTPWERRQYLSALWEPDPRAR